jgi:hypothetical protein
VAGPGKFVFLEYDKSLQSEGGEWNTFEIKATNQKYSVILNGKKVISEFIGNRLTEGYIGIQNHEADSNVSFDQDKGDMILPIVRSQRLDIIMP